MRNAQQWPDTVCLKALERVKGIEPSYAAWEAAVLPLNYTRIAHGVALYRKAALTAQSIASNFRSGRDAPRALSGRIAAR